MPDAINFQIKGARQVSKALDALGKTTARRIGGNAVRAGARVIRDEAKTIAPAGIADDVQRDIRVRTAKQSELEKPTQRRAIVDFKPNTKARRLAHLFEFGTVERSQSTTGRRTGRMIADPFMRPALDIKKFQALGKMAETIRKELKKETAKLKGIRSKR